MIHPNLAALASLAMADEDAASLSVKVTLSHRECLADAQPSTPEQHHKGPGPQSLRSLAGDAHHRHDLLHRWRVGRVAPALVARRTAAMESGHGRGRAATARCVEPGRSSHAQQPLRLGSYAPASCRRSRPKHEPCPVARVGCCFHAKAGLLRPLRGGSSTGPLSWASDTLIRPRPC